MVEGRYLEFRLIPLQEGNAYLYTIPRLEKAASLSFLTPAEANKPTFQKTNSGLSNPKNLRFLVILDGTKNVDDDEIYVETPKQQPANWRASLLSKLNIIDKNKTTYESI